MNPVWMKPSSLVHLLSVPITQLTRRPVPIPTALTAAQLFNHLIADSSLIVEAIKISTFGRRVASPHIAWFMVCPIDHASWLHFIVSIRQRYKDTITHVISDLSQHPNLFKERHDQFQQLRMRPSLLGSSILKRRRIYYVSMVVHWNLKFLILAMSLNTHCYHAA